MAGFGLNLKLVLYLQSQCLTESLGFLIRHIAKLRNDVANVKKNVKNKVMITKVEIYTFNIHDKNNDDVKIKFEGNTLDEIFTT
ncbi:hypothetical protein JE950_001903 [Flavobacterium psychrophilum]|nr:hypothetical protein [Flavobacterium psychrophilum]